MASTLLDRSSWRGLRSTLAWALPKGRGLPEQTWRARHLGILALVAAHVLFIPAFALYRGYGVGHALFEASPVAVFGLAALLWPGSRTVRASLAGVALITASAVITHLSGGYIEAHFHFFVMIGVMALYQEWVPYLLAIGYVAVHHGVVGVLDPASVFNHADAFAHPWKWAGIHAGMIAFAAAVSVVAWRFNEAAREESELVLSAAGEGILGVDPDGTVTFANPAASTLTGRSESELVGGRLPEFVALPPGPFAGPGVVTGEILRADGTRAPAEILRATKVEGGAVERVVVSFRDVTEQRRAEREVRRTAASLAEAQRLARLGSWTWDVRSNALEWSREVARMHGLAPGDAVTYDAWAASVHPEDRARVSGVVEQALDDGIPYAVEYRVVVGGAVRHVLGRGQVERDADGNVVRLVGTAQDVTDLKETETALRASEERLKEIVENSTNLFYAHTADHKLTYVSPRSWDFLACSPEDALVHWTEFATAHPANALGFAITERALATGERQVPYELELRRTDGRLIWVEVNEAPVVRDGEVVGMVGSLTDVTDRKRAEEARQAAEAELRRLNDELERRVAERTRELENANRELEAFSYSVSHDLRAPLRSIDGFSKALVDAHGGDLDPAAQKDLERIRAAAQKMGQLIDDMLKLSRVTRAEVRKDRVDLSTMVRMLAEDLRRREPERRVEVAVPDGVKAECDPRLAGILLTNLLENAWKFTSKHPEAHIEFGAVERDDERVFYVRDDGAGFDPEYAGKLFAPFQRLHNSSEFDGTGIGLATVQRIVERHGGHVWAEGAVEKGATVYFTLGGKRT